MKTTQLLLKLAQNLVDPDNEILQSSEENPELLSVVAECLAKAAYEILETAEKTSQIEPPDTEALETMSALASACDESEDPELNKLASVLDEILLSVGTPDGAINALKKAEDNEINKLRSKYREEKGEDLYTKSKKEYDEQNKLADSVKTIEDKVKNYRPMQHALNTRYSPDMPGVSLMRIGDSVYQDPVTKQIYNFETGYTTMDGDKIPGTTVSNQTQAGEFIANEHMNFSTRDTLLNDK